ncbi:MAG: hypothetical protein H0V44_17900 [Planctomycetes bacterium]|nr:hypothetical protein [Planctomycetota bacterium]
MVLLSATSALAAAQADDGGWVWKAPDLAPPVLTGSAPTVDGQLDEVSWTTAARSDSFLLADGRGATCRTRLMVLRDEQTLYIGVECFDTAEALQALTARAGISDPAQALWADDCVEIFIDPTNRRVSYYQIIGSFRQATWSTYLTGVDSPDPSWRQKYPFAASIGASCWTIEFALPLAMFDRGGQRFSTWAFNVSRTRKDAELVYWSPVFNSSSHSPETFGTLSGMPTK